MPIASAFITALSEKEYPDFKQTKSGISAAGIEAKPLFYFVPAELTACNFGTLGDSEIKAKPYLKSTTEQDMHWLVILDYKDTLYVYNKVTGNILNICMGRAPITEAKLEFSLLTTTNKENSIMVLVGTKPGVSLQGCTSLDMLKHKCELFVQFNLQSMLVLTYHPLDVYYNVSETDAFFSKFGNELTHTLDSKQKIIPTETLNRVLKGMATATVKDGMLYQTIADTVEQEDREDSIETTEYHTQEIAFIEGSVSAYIRALKIQGSLTDSLWSLLDAVSDNSPTLAIDIVCLMLANHKYQYSGPALTNTFSIALQNRLVSTISTHISEAFNKDFVSLRSLDLYLTDGILVSSPILLKGLIEGNAGYKVYALVAQVLGDSTPIDSVVDLLTVDHLLKGAKQRSKAAGVPNFEYKYEYNESSGLLDTIVLQNAALRLLCKNDDRVHTSDIYNLVAAPNTFDSNASGMEYYDMEHHYHFVVTTEFLNKKYTLLTGDKKGWAKKVPFNMAILYYAMAKKSISDVAAMRRLFADAVIPETNRSDYIRDWQRFMLPDYEVFNRTTTKDYELRSLIFMLQFYRLYPFASLLLKHNDVAFGATYPDADALFGSVRAFVTAMMKLLYLGNFATSCQELDILFSTKLQNKEDMSLYLKAYKKAITIFKECCQQSNSIPEVLGTFNSRIDCYLEKRRLYYFLKTGERYDDSDVGSAYWRFTLEWFINTDESELAKNQQRDAFYVKAFDDRNGKNVLAFKLVYDYLNKRGYSNGIPYPYKDRSVDREAFAYLARCIAHTKGWVDKSEISVAEYMQIGKLKPLVTNVDITVIASSYDYDNDRNRGFSEYIIGRYASGLLDTLMRPYRQDKGIFDVARFNADYAKLSAQFEEAVDARVALATEYVDNVPMYDILYITKEAPNLVSVLPHTGFACVWCISELTKAKELVGALKAYFDMLVEKRHEYGLFGCIPFSSGSASALTYKATSMSSEELDSLFSTLVAEYPNRPTYALIPLDKLQDIEKLQETATKGVLTTYSIFRLMLQNHAYYTSRDVAMSYAVSLSLQTMLSKFSVDYVERLMHYYNGNLPKDFDVNNYETFTFVVHTLLLGAFETTAVSTLEKFEAIGLNLIKAIKTILSLQQYLIVDKALGEQYDNYYKQNR